MIIYIFYYPGLVSSQDTESAHLIWSRLNMVVKKKWIKWQFKKKYFGELDWRTKFSFIFLDQCLPYGQHIRIAWGVLKIQMS